jgi:hypothetical protein
MGYKASIGSHSFKAVFVGTPNGATDYEGSTSSAAKLTVTARAATSWITTTVSGSSGVAGSYDIRAQVYGTGPAAATGSVSFIDTSEGNAVLATAPLGAGAAQLNWAAAGSFGGGLFVPELAVAGDFNGDGIPDLAVGSNSETTLQVYLGLGNGTFTRLGKGGMLEGYLDPTSLAVGDFNGDGNQDIAAVGFTSNGGISYDGGLIVMLGDGTGHFTMAPSSQTGLDQPTSVAVADFNGDGILDLAVANRANSDFDASVTVLLGNGDGTFTAVSAFPLPGGPGGALSFPASVVAGDFNGDGIPDIAATINEGNAVSTVIVMLGNGDGTFTAAASPQIDGYPLALQVADFNGDGFLDLAVVSTPDYQSEDLTVLLGNGHGAFTAEAPASLPVAFFGPYFYAGSLAVGDFSGDGVPDLAVAGSTSVVILPGKGDGTFLTPATVAQAPGATLAVADFNGDGVPDLALIDGSGEVLLTTTKTATTAVIPVNLTPGSGLHEFKASYAGDATHLASQADFSLQAARGTPAVSIASSASSVTYGTSVTFTATLTGTGLTPTGTVTIYDGGLPLGAATISGGKATYITSSLVPATLLVSAWYSGDANYPQAISKGVKVTVTKAPLTVTANSLSMVKGAATPALTYTLSGFVHGDTAFTAVTGAPKLTTTATKTSPAGVYPIVISAGTLTAEKYSFVFKNGTLTVNP